MTTPNPALVESSERNRKFWLEQRLLMDQRMENRDILEIAIETIAFEAKRGVSVRSQMSFEKALENAAEAKKRFLDQQARSGGKAAKPDTFQMIIIDIVRRDPKIGVAGLLNGLRQREGDGVIEEVDDTAYLPQTWRPSRDAQGRESRREKSDFRRSTKFRSEA